MTKNKKSSVSKNTNIEKTCFITFFIDLIGIITISLNMMFKEGRCQNIVVGSIFGIITLGFYLSFATLLFRELSFYEKENNIEKYNEKLNLLLLLNSFFILVFFIFCFVKIKNLIKKSKIFPSNK